MTSVIGHDAFVRIVANELEIAVDELDTLSFEALGLDSLQLFEIDLVVEELGVLLDEEALAASRTIHDVYGAYFQAMESGSV